MAIRTSSCDSTSLRITAGRAEFEREAPYLPTDLLADLEKIAEASDRTRSWVMVRAFRHYLAGEGADILAILKGREEIAEGKVHDVDGVLKEIEDIVRGNVASSRRTRSSF